MTEPKNIYGATIYLTVESIEYLRKSGRITPAALTFAALLKIKPILTIQGEKLDAYGKTRGRKQALKMMVKALQDDVAERFSEAAAGNGISFYSAYTGDRTEAEVYVKELEEIFQAKFTLEPLSLSVACHIGDGAIGIGVVKNLTRKSE